jgi:hypothetical protein
MTEAPLNGSVKRAAYRGYTRRKHTRRTHTSTTRQRRPHQWARRLDRHLKMVHTVSGHGHIYHLVSQLYPNVANKPGYGQLYIFDSTEATTKPSDQGRMAELMQ